MEKGFFFLSHLSVVVASKTLHYFLLNSNYYDILQKRLSTYQVGAKVEPQLLEHLDEYGNIVSIGWNVSKLLR